MFDQIPPSLFPLNVDPSLLTAGCWAGDRRRLEQVFPDLQIPELKQTLPTSVFYLFNIFPSNLFLQFLFEEIFSSAEKYN